MNFTHISSPDIATFSCKLTRKSVEERIEKYSNVKEEYERAIEELTLLTEPACLAEIIIGVIKQCVSLRYDNNDVIIAFIITSHTHIAILAKQYLKFYLHIFPF